MFILTLYIFVEATYQHYKIYLPKITDADNRNSWTCMCSTSCLVSSFHSVWRNFTSCSSYIAGTSVKIFLIIMNITLYNFYIKTTKEDKTKVYAIHMSGEMQPSKTKAVCNTHIWINTYLSCDFLSCDFCSCDVFPFTIYVYNISFIGRGVRKSNNDFIEISCSPMKRQTIICISDFW
jgi:hypothetical protein